MGESYRKFDDKSDQLWWEIQDIIGPAGEWPKFIVDMFFTRNLNHRKRPLLCAFVIFNGLNPEVNFVIFIQILTIVNTNILNYIEI